MLKNKFNLFANWLMNKSPIVLRVIFICALGALVLIGIYLFLIGLIAFFLDLFNPRYNIDFTTVVISIVGFCLIKFPTKVLWKNNIIQNHRGNHKFWLGIAFIILGGSGLLMSACGIFLSINIVITKLLMTKVDYFAQFVFVFALPSLIIGAIFMFIIYWLLRKEVKKTNYEDH